MTKENVHSHVVGALLKVMGNASKSDPALRLDDPAADPQLAAFGLNSLDVVEWCMEIEAATGVEFDPAEIAGLETLNAVVGFISGRLGVETAEPDAPALEPVSRDRPLVLSFTQEAMWRNSQFPESAANFVVATVDRIQGPLEPGVLCDCLDYIVRRHEILRTSYAEADGQPVQFVHAPEPLALPMLTLPPGTDPAAATAWIAQSEMMRVADLRQPPLIRFVLFRVTPEEHWLLRLCHHILWDEWSAKILIRELALLYPARIDGAPRPLPETEPLQYADYAAWQRRSLYEDSPAYQEDIRWWQDLYAGLPEEPNPPFLRAGPREDVTPNDGVLLSPVDEGLTERLYRFVRQERATVYTVWLAALAALLPTETGQKDAIVGSYMTNRRRPQLQNMIGCFFNIAVLRLRGGGANSFRDWLSHVRACTVEAEAHSEIPNELLKSTLAARCVAMPELHVIFGAPLAYSRADTQFAGLTLTRPDWPLVAAMPWRISIDLHEYDGVQEFRATFDARFHAPEKIRNFIGRLTRFVDAALQQPDESLQKHLELSAETPSDTSV